MLLNPRLLDGLEPSGEAFTKYNNSEGRRPTGGLGKDTGVAAVEVLNRRF